MPKEHPVKRNQPTAAHKQIDRPTHEKPAPLPEITAPVELSLLPASLARAQIARLQRLVGNDAAQSALSTAGIQRAPGKPAAGAPPIPLLPELDARRALAIDILKKAFGGRIKQESKVTGLKSARDVRDRYDEAMIGHPFPVKAGEEPRVWVKGDVDKCDRTMGDFPGFLDPGGKGVIIDLSRKPDEQVATIAHEMLHDNASPEFQTRFGRSIDEGMTEKLLQQAFSAAGYAAPSGFFEGEIALVSQIGALFGEGTMTAAYFAGPQILQSVMVGVTDDEELFDKFCNEVRKVNWGWLDPFFTRYAELAKKSEIEKKIGAIQSLLDWWVSDEDLSHIENIIAGSSVDEKAQIRAAILPRVISLSDHGQRARLRLALSQ